MNIYRQSHPPLTLNSFVPVLNKLRDFQMSRVQKYNDLVEQYYAHLVT